MSDEPQESTEELLARVNRIVDKRHAKDHEHIEKAIRNGWGHGAHLVAHLVRYHDLKMDQIDNAGPIVFHVGHDNAHGKRVFAHVEDQLDDGPRRGLATLRREDPDEAAS